MRGIVFAIIGTLIAMAAPAEAGWTCTTYGTVTTCSETGGGTIRCQQYGTITRCY